MMKLLGILLGFLLIYYSPYVATFLNHFLDRIAPGLAVDGAIVSSVLIGILITNFLFMIVFRNREQHSFVIWAMMSMFCSILVALVYTGYLIKLEEYSILLTFVLLAVVISWISMICVYVDLWIRERRTEQVNEHDSDEADYGDDAYGHSFNVAIQPRSRYKINVEVEPQDGRGQKLSKQVSQVEATPLTELQQQKQEVAATTTIDMEQSKLTIDTDNPTSTEIHPITGSSFPPRGRRKKK